MIKKLRTIFILIIAVGFFCFAPRVSAESGGIDIFYPGKPGPIFAKNNWSPGNSISETIRIRNNQTTTRKLGIQILNILGPAGLAEKISLEIKGNGTDLSSPINDLLSPNESLISSINPGDSEFLLTISMAKTVENQYQNQQIFFDIKFGFFPIASNTESATISFRPNATGTTNTFQKTLETNSLGETVPPFPEEKNNILGQQAEGGGALEIPWWLWMIISGLTLGLFFILWRRRKNEDENKD